VVNNTTSIAVNFRKKNRYLARVSVKNGRLAEVLSREGPLTEQAQYEKERNSVGWG